MAQRVRTNSAQWMEKQQRWQIKVQKKGVRRSFYSSTPGRKGKMECHAKADEWLSDDINGQSRVEELYPKFIEEKRTLAKNGNYSNAINCQSIGDNWILPFIGKKHFDDLCEQDFQDILNDAYQKGKSKKTIKNIRGVMSGMLKYARKRKATKMTTADLEIPDGAPVGHKTILQPDELAVLFESQADYIYLHAFRFYVAVGLRRGELLALQTERDIRDGVCYVRESINKYNQVTPGKTKNAQREIVLTPLAQSIIEDQKAMLHRMGIKSKYLFCTKFGERIYPNAIYTCWKRYCKRREIPEISIQEMRHTFISMCKEVPLELLKTQVGHSDDMDTFGQYGHEIDGEKIRAASLISEQLGRFISKKDSKVG